MSFAPPPVTDYDVVAYPPGSYRQSHPERLATIGTLLGMRPTPVGSCRVLEVGCGDGSNLIPMAVALPGSEFVGVDLAAAPIERGRALIAAAGLRNVRLEAMNLLEFPEDAGNFDYMIAHGFFSWVPDIVRKKWWSVVAKHLAGNGITYGSYNAYPAGHLRMAMRDLMRFHSERAGVPSRERAATGRDFLKKLAGEVKGPEVWKSVLAFESQRMEKRRAEVIHHDEMGDTYRPFLFSELAGEAVGAGLQYMAEASLRRLFTPLAQGLPEELLEREQYLDYLEFQSFRESVFCRREIPLEREELLARLSGTWLASSLRPEKGGGGDVTKFRERSSEGVIQTNDPGLVRILMRLAETWPSAVPFDELPDGNGASGKIGQLVSAGLVELRAHPLVPARAPGRVPVATALARVQLASGSRTTNLLHTIVEITAPEVRQLMGVLNGTATKATVDRTCAGIPGGSEAVLDGLFHHGLLLY